MGGRPQRSPSWRGAIAVTPGSRPSTGTAGSDRWSACRWGLSRCAASTPRRPWPRDTKPWNLLSISTRLTASDARTVSPQENCPAWRPSRGSVPPRTRPGRRQPGRPLRRGPGAITGGGSGVTSFWPAKVMWSAISSRLSIVSTGLSRGPGRPLRTRRGRPGRFSMPPGARRNCSALFSWTACSNWLRDPTDATAFEALRVLARSGQCPPRKAVEAARAVLRRYRSLDAGQLLAVLEPDLRPDDLPDLLDQLISLASGQDDPDLAPAPWELPSSPEGLIAASHVDLPAVTARVIEHLASDDDLTREAGAEAARVLLAQDATRVVALGRPLAASVRGEDNGYAGYPHPASAALRALAEAWRGEPELTRRIVEAEAAKASEEARAELSRVPWSLQRFRDPWDASAAATSEAVSFVVRRSGGDWGEEAADHAAEHLTSLAREIPEAVAAHFDGMLGAILALCAPDQDTQVPAAPGTGAPAMLAALDRESLRMRRTARQRRLAETVGRCASVSPAAVFGAVRDLFSAETGDEPHDRAVRLGMLQILQKAVSPGTLRDVLPFTYTALLDARSAGAQRRHRPVGRVRRCRRLAARRTSGAVGPAAPGPLRHRPPQDAGPAAAFVPAGRAGTYAAADRLRLGDYLRRQARSRHPGSGDLGDCGTSPRSSTTRRRLPAGSASRWPMPASAGRTTVSGCSRPGGRTSFASTRPG